MSSRPRLGCLEPQFSLHNIQQGLRGPVSGTAIFEINDEKQSCLSLENELSTLTTGMLNLLS